MSIEIIFDGGSCHEGDYWKALQLAKVAKEAGADAIKFQLCPESNGNIPFKKEWLSAFATDCKNLGIDFFCSVWNMCDALLLTMEQDSARLPRKLKIAYSQRKYAEDILEDIKNTTCYITSDIMTDIKIKSEAATGNTYKKLWTYSIHGVAVYPVHCKIDFAGIFPLFDGFSDHSMWTYSARNAISWGAIIIEKHLCLSRKQPVPDARFALEAIDAHDFVKRIRTGRIKA